MAADSKPTIAESNKSLSAEHQPQAATTVEPRKTSIPRLMGSVSVNPVLGQDAKERVMALTQQSDVPIQPLTQERLNKYWDQLLENETFAPLLRGKSVEVTGKTTFNIIANNSYFETELKEYKTPILQQLREWTGIRELFCNVEVRAEVHEEKLYRPTDKFDSMAADNPEMYNLRKILTEIDY